MDRLRAYEVLLTSTMDEICQAFETLVTIIYSSCFTLVIVLNIEVTTLHEALIALILISYLPCKQIATLRLIKLLTLPM